MKTLSYLFGGLVWAGLFAPTAIMMAQGVENQAALQQSSIVFEGTVRQMGATSFAEVPKSEKTIVVRVDSVLKKPAAVSLKPDDNVTVEVKVPSDFHEGTRATFYTDGWILGSGLAVKELGHEIAPPGGAGARGQAIALVQGQLSNQQLRDQLNSADAVVVGRVTEIHPWTASTLAATPRHISEHDPDWQEAVVQVQSAIMGAEAGQKIVVRFPGSMDVAWFNAHKFKKGEQGTFLLKKDQVTGTPKALMGGSEVDAYTALRQGDVLSTAEAARVRSLLNK